MTTATANAPSIVALEDIEAIASRRDVVAAKPAAEEGKRDEYSQTMLQLKDLLDGTTPLPSNVVFIATCSRPELLDEVFVARFTRIDLPTR